MHGIVHDRLLYVHLFVGHCTRLTPTVLDDFSGGGRYADRPNVVGDPKLGSKVSSSTGWWNKAAFTLPERGTFGNAGPGILEDSGYVITDISLMKRFDVAAGRTFQFRREIFNLFSHTNFFLPNTTFDALDFGTVGTNFHSTTNKGLAYYILVRTVHDKTAEVVYTTAVPWGGTGVAVEFMGAYENRESRKHFMVPGAAFVELENGKIRRLRVVSAAGEASEVLGPFTV